MSTSSDGAKTTPAPQPLLGGGKPVELCSDAPTLMAGAGCLGTGLSDPLGATFKGSKDGFLGAPWGHSKDGGSHGDTTMNAWSPSAFPVSHFTSRNIPADARVGGLREPYSGGAPLLAATLDGVVHLVHGGADDSSILTETFSLSGIMTLALPVNCYASDGKTTSNGFGTLAQAGWTEQEPLSVARDSGGAMALAGTPDAIVPLTVHEGGGAVTVTEGRYQ